MKKWAPTETRAGARPAVGRTGGHLRVAPVLLAAALLALVPGGAPGQDVRPGDERPELPGYADPSQAAPRLQLPPVPDFEPREPGSAAAPGVLPPPPRTPDAEAFEAGGRVRFEQVLIRGNTSVADDVLQETAAGYLGRELSFDDLLALRDALTAVYTDRGFATSVAVLPEQSVTDGSLEVWIVEGKVVEIEVQTSGRLRPGYVRDRLELAVGPPVNIDALERRLRILQDDERIASLEASLSPTERLGEALLRVRVLEAQPWHVRLSGNNYSSPLVGEGRGEARLGWNNVTGLGDAIQAEYKGNGFGLNDVRARWEVPVTRYDTRFGLHYRGTWTDVQESPFDDLGIKGKTRTFGFRLSQPLYQGESAQLGAFLTGEWRRSESFLFGDPFSFILGQEDGEATVVPLRLGVDYAWRERNRILAARSTFSVGLPILGYTKNPSGIPDGRFFSWLGQIQGAIRLPDLWGVQVLARADWQIANDALFGIEQFAIGGHATVRGYRENRLVRDNGVVGSLELRLPVPLPSWREWRPTFEIAPFVDAGYSWNADRPDPGAQTLVSAGIGGRFGLWEGLRLEIYWGEALKDVPTLGDSLQDDGVHLGLTWER